MDQAEKRPELVIPGVLDGILAGRSEHPVHITEQRQSESRPSAEAGPLAVVHRGLVMGRVPDRKPARAIAIRGPGR
jgi:hypothetical protein